MNPETKVTKNILTKEFSNGSVEYRIESEEPNPLFTLIMDVTSVLRPAVNKDRRQGYELEDGPNFYIELQRAAEYFYYVLGCCFKPHEVTRFNTTRGYLFSTRRET